VQATIHPPDGRRTLAIYHVINRGNYRRDVFGTDGAARAFETALGERVSATDGRLAPRVGAWPWPGIMRT